MAKVMTAKVKLQCPGGQATPAPPVGPALGQHGVNIGQFVMQFNERTKEMKGTTIPVEITIYSDRSFEFITKSPPAADPAQAGRRHCLGIGRATQDQGWFGDRRPGQARSLRPKLNDLNARDIEHACRIIAGTARSAGIEIKGLRAKPRPERLDWFLDRTTQVDSSGRTDPGTARPPAATCFRARPSDGWPRTAAASILEAVRIGQCIISPSGIEL